VGGGVDAGSHVGDGFAEGMGGRLRGNAGLGRNEGGGGHAPSSHRSFCPIRAYFSAAIGEVDIRKPDR
jgi:hypothetical protein